MVFLLYHQVERSVEGPVQAAEVVRGVGLGFPDGGSDEGSVLTGQILVWSLTNPFS